MLRASAAITPAEEQRHRARACVAADDRADHAEHDLLRVAAVHAHQLILDELCIRLTVAVADEDGLIRLRAQLAKLLRQRPQRSLALGFLVAGALQRRRGAQPPAPGRIRRTGRGYALSCRADRQPSRIFR